MKTSDATLGSGDERRTRSRVEHSSPPSALRGWSALVAALVAIGIVLRLTYYLLNPALSSDEAALALNLMHRSFSGLFDQALDVNQAAPAGFLVLQKLAITAFGPGPHALRLLPLAAALAALALIYPVARRFVGARAAVLALALFAISDPLITYAGTNKQYSVDVAVVLALYGVVLAARETFAAREALLLALCAAIAVWLSHAAVFVVAGIVTVLLFEAARARKFADFAWISSVVAFWLGSFAAAYSLTHASVAHLQSSIAGIHPSLLSLLHTLGGMARFLFGVPAFAYGIRSAIALVAITLVGVGAVTLWRARPPRAALLLVPCVFALVAAQLGKYALFPRTFLFLIPALVIFAARGTLSVMAARRALTVVLGAAAFAIVFAAAAYATSDHLRSRREADPLRVLRYLTDHAQRDDSVYVHLSAQLGFRYYLECGCFGTSETVRKARSLWPVQPPTSDSTFIRSAPPDLVAGKYDGDIPSGFHSDFAPLRRRARVWILTMRFNGDLTGTRQRALATYLRQNGRRIDVFPDRGREVSATVSLYDLR